MGALLGLDGNLYYLSTGTRATWGNAVSGIHTGAAPGNLVAIDAVRDLTMNVEKGEADVSTRGNNGWKANLGTLKDASVEINTIWDKDDAGLQALLAAFLENENIALAALDGLSNTNGTQGFWADFQVMSFNKGEPLEEGQTVDITVKPALTNVAPEWVEVG
jgi:hypothetical protein